MILRSSARLAPPRLRVASSEERHATWLELFFDLVLVAAILQLGTSLADEPTLSGAVRFVLLLTPIWWAWVGFSMYADRFDSDDLVFRLFMVAGMGAVAAMAVSSPAAFEHASTAFALGYVANRLVLVALFVRARWHITEIAPLARVSIGAYLGGATVWLASLLVHDPARSLLWVAAICLEGVVPWLFRRAMISVPTHVSHLPERFGLFTIIVLGESILSLVLGLHHAEWSARAALIAAGYFAVAVGAWWLYFGLFGDTALRPGLLSRNVFIYAHLPVALGLVMSGAGAKVALSAHDSAALAHTVWLLGGGAALFLAAIAALVTWSRPARETVGG